MRANVKKWRWRIAKGRRTAIKTKIQMRRLLMSWKVDLISRKRPLPTNRWALITTVLIACCPIIYGLLIIELNKKFPTMGHMYCQYLIEDCVGGWMRVPMGFTTNGYLQRGATPRTESGARTCLAGNVYTWFIFEEKSMITSGKFRIEWVQFEL